MEQGRTRPLLQPTAGPSGGIAVHRHHRPSNYCHSDPPSPVPSKTDGGGAVGDDGAATDVEEVERKIAGAAAGVTDVAAEGDVVGVVDADAVAACLRTKDELEKVLHHQNP